MSPATLRIGEVAARAAVNIQTLRYYERRGLLEKPTRTSAGYRVYPPDAVRIVRFIKRAQELGFTLTEVGELLRLRADQSASCRRVRAAASEKIDSINSKVQSLRAMKRALTVLVESCSSKGSTRVCPILEALDNPSPKGRKP